MAKFKTAEEVIEMVMRLYPLDHEANRRDELYSLYFNKTRKCYNAIRQFVFQRDGNECLCCGDKDSLTMDHIIPKSQGGLFTPENLQTLCKECNFKKGVYTIDYRLFPSKQPRRFKIPIQKEFKTVGKIVLPDRKGRYKK